MNQMDTILRMIVAWLPVASGMTWGMLMWLASYDSMTEQETRLKRLLVVFFFLSCFAWFSVFAYTWLPGWFAILNVPAYVVYLLTPIQFYRFIRALSDEQARSFPAVHYLLPGVICGTLFVWSLFVPYEVDLALVEGRGAVYSGYEAYSRLFLSKPLARLLFSTYYTGFSLLLLYRYYRRITRPGDVQGRYPSRWIALLMALTISLYIGTIVVAVLPRGRAFNSVIILLPVFILVSQHLILVYNVIRRNFLPYALSVPRPLAKKPMPQTNRKTYTRYGDSPISREQFEDYIRKNKPYLNPQLKINALADALEVNRTYLSGFINQTYGVNFNVYINRCRLAELDRIRHLPSNARKKAKQLVLEVGFGSYRSYQRACDMVNKEKERDDS